MAKKSKSITTDGVKFKPLNFCYFIDMVKCHYDFVGTPEVDLLEEDLVFFITAYDCLLEHFRAHPHDVCTPIVAQTLNGLVEILSANKRLAVDDSDAYAEVLARYLDLKDALCVSAISVSLTKAFYLALTQTHDNLSIDSSMSHSSPIPRSDSLYVVDFGNVVKIGRSIRPEQRMRTITTSSGRRFQGGYIAKEHGHRERQAHQILHKYRMVGEFFECDIKTAMTMLECLGLEWLKCAA